MRESRSRATFVAPANIAFIKYWGIRDEARVVPTNPSISMTLSRCVSKCTVEFDSRKTGDQIRFRRSGARGFEPAAEGFARPVLRQLEMLRRRAQKNGAFRVWTENSFPTGAGIASSASGFSALTLAACEALGAPPADRAEASVLTRLSGSGSAARSVFGGYVEWPAPGSTDDVPAVRIAAADHWELCDVVAVVDASAKEVSSRDGHRRAPTSPRFGPRLEELDDRLRTVRDAIDRRDIEALGTTLETEAIDLHQVAMTSKPPIYYWRPGTLAVLWAIRSLRSEGVAVYATIDAGPNVHAICPAEFEEPVAEAFESMREVETVLRDRVGTGPYSTDEHLGDPT